MPGIVGFIGRGSPEVKRDELHRMVQCMIHESFYSSGTYTNEEMGVWIGWVNRSGSFTDCMPVWNETRDVCLILSGENFADNSVIDGLAARGHQFDPENATYLVHLYEEMGLDFINVLNGRFTAVVIDLRSQRAIVCNDRYASERLYIHQDADGLLFSSEAKSLLAVRPHLRRLDVAGLAETFSCGTVLQNRTLFSGVGLLPAASTWAVTKEGSVEKRRYFNPADWENQSPLNSEEFYLRLKETFARILPRYLRGRNQIGMSLTGGLDGRMIMAWARLPPGALPCYTFAGMYRECSDVRVARLVATACGQSHETIPVGTDFLADFGSLAERTIHISDGAMDVGPGAVELYINRVARQIAPVRLNGVYGSEILRGSVAFKHRQMVGELLAPQFSAQVLAASGTYDAELQGNQLSFIAFKQASWHHCSRLSVELSQVSMRSPYMDNELVSLMYQAPQSEIAGTNCSLRLIEDGSADLARIPTDRGLLRRHSWGIPQFRHLYQVFTSKAEYAYDYGMPQWLATIDHRLAPLHLEKLFLGRHKFYHFRTWYGRELSLFVKQILLDPRTLSRPYLNGAKIEKALSDHIAGKRNYTSEINRILTSELVERILIEQRT
jgi:asparagine synthase (glutamine-hydrolysing)